jgi:hypothetical protein
MAGAADKVKQKMAALKEDADKAEAHAADLERQLKESNMRMTQVLFSCSVEIVTF